MTPPAARRCAVRNGQGRQCPRLVAREVSVHFDAELYRLECPTWAWVPMCLLHAKRTRSVQWREVRR